MQYILLAAGKGQRLGMNVTNKCFVTVCGKTLLDYNLELIPLELISEIIIVVGYNSNYIEQYVGENYKGIPVIYVHQEPLLGIAHAIKTAIPYIKEDFIFCLSDELHINPHVTAMRNFFLSSGADCVCGVVRDTIENIQKAYTIELDEKNNVSDLIENPTKCFNNIKGTGICIMKQSMLPILNALKPNIIRGEFEMGNWIQLGIDYGLVCKVFNVSDINFNINETTDLLAAEKYLNMINSITKEDQL